MDISETAYRLWQAFETYRTTEMFRESPFPMEHIVKSLEEVYNMGVLDATLPKWGEDLQVDVQIKSAQRKVYDAIKAGQDHTGNFRPMGESDRPRKSPGEKA